MTNESGNLILKRASALLPSGEWNDDHYDVLADGIVVGRISRRRSSKERQVAAFHIELWIGPAHRNDPGAWHARANQWQQITKRLGFAQFNMIGECVGRGK